MQENVINVLERVQDMLLDDNITISQIAEFVAGACMAFGGEQDD